MKSYLVLVLLFLSSICLAQKKTEIGITGGFRTSIISISDTYELYNPYEILPGWFLGVNYNIPLKKNKIKLGFGIDHSLIRDNTLTTFNDEFAVYIAGSARALESSFFTNLSSIYLVSVNKWQFGTGLQVRYLINSKTYIKDGIPLLDKNSVNNNYLSKVNIDIPIEISYQLSEKFTLLGKYERSLTNRLKTEGESLKESTNTIRFGVEFKLK